MFPNVFHSLYPTYYIYIYPYIFQEHAYTHLDREIIYRVRHLRLLSHIILLRIVAYTQPQCKLSFRERASPVRILKWTSVGPPLIKRTFIIYIASRQSTTYYAASATFVSRKYHNFLPRNDYNLSFVTCNHCHNVSLSYVYSQILIGEWSKMWLPD